MTSKRKITEVLDTSTKQINKVTVVLNEDEYLVLDTSIDYFVLLPELKTQLINLPDPFGDANLPKIIYNCYVFSIAHANAMQSWRQKKYDMVNHADTCRDFYKEVEKTMDVRSRSKLSSSKFVSKVRCSANLTIDPGANTMYPLLQSASTKCKFHDCCAFSAFINCIIDLTNDRFKAMSVKDVEDPVFNKRVDESLRNLGFCLAECKQHYKLAVAKEVGGKPTIEIDGVKLPVGMSTDTVCRTLDSILAKSLDTDRELPLPVRIDKLCKRIFSIFSREQTLISLEHEVCKDGTRFPVPRLSNWLRAISMNSMFFVSIWKCDCNRLRDSVEEVLSAVAKSKARSFIVTGYNTVTSKKLDKHCLSIRKNSTGTYVINSDAYLQFCRDGSQNVCTLDEAALQFHLSFGLSELFALNFHERRLETLKTTSQNWKKIINDLE